MLNSLFAALVATTSLTVADSETPVQTPAPAVEETCSDCVDGKALARPDGKLLLPANETEEETSVN